MQVKEHTVLVCNSNSTFQMRSIGQSRAQGTEFIDNNTSSALAMVQEGQSKGISLGIIHKIFKGARAKQWLLL